MDRHEYEINQLINPKKDIVKSNSKHRDNLETLILGRRIGGIVGGGDPPKNILEDGKYKFDTAAGSGQYFSAYKVVDGRAYVYAESLGGTNNLNIYGPTGTIIARQGPDTILGAIQNICSAYDNFVGVTKEVQLGKQIADFDTYIEL